MKFLKRLKNRRGFTLAELMIVIAVIAILAGIAFAFVDPNEISYVEYNRSAEAIATAVQNRLTEIRNAGDMATLRSMGEQATAPASTSMTRALEAGASDPGGYRYIFNYTCTNVEGKTVTTKKDVSYLLPFGAIDLQLANNFFVIGFQSDTGMVGEVFYSTQPFASSVSDLSKYQNADTRKTDKVGYYQGTVADEKIAFANLPTPQLTITNYEELTLSIYLPDVKQLREYGKQLGILISLSDRKGAAFASGSDLTLADTAIYSTFYLGSTTPPNSETAPSIVSQTIESGTTYKIVLDNVRNTVDTQTQLVANGTGPIGTFEDWARKSQAYKNNLLLLGDNSVITVTVYCLQDTTNENYDAASPVDPTFMPRSASITFNGWFNDCKYNKDETEGTVEIACGRHLQNLGKLTEMRSSLLSYRPEATLDNDTGIYSYSDYNYGLARTYTDGTSGSSKVEPYVSYDDAVEKYIYRSDVQQLIIKANQVNAIDFNCSEWMQDEKRIPFTPVNLPKSFYYYGNYLTISHLYVDAPFYAGLFGYVYHVRLYDMQLVNPDVSSQMPAHLSELYEMGVGALIGTSRDSSHINNCQAYMTQEGNQYHADTYRVEGECYVGGLIGFCEDENIKNCSASVYTGYQKGATKTVYEKAADGTVTSTDLPLVSKYVGGLIGCITGDSSIEECYAAGNLSGSYVGGLVGYIVEDSDPSGDDYHISTCYTAGHIEYAENEAAGILGYVSELAGNAKSALRVYYTYCVVIYGETTDDGASYHWDCKLPNGTAVPIYGTFKGDGFEWLRTQGSYFKGRYGDRGYFAGAIFENENQNYYIAQKGITYSNSPYYLAMRDTVKDIRDNIQGVLNTPGHTDKDLTDAIDAAKEKIFYLKKIQALEDLKRRMESILYEVDSETGIGKDNNPYNYGKTVYLDTVKAEVHSSSGSSTDNGEKVKYIELTFVQLVHALYNGEYPNGSGTTKITLKHTDHPEVSDFTFMGIYNTLKETYGKLLDDNKTNDEDAKEKLDLILGEDNGQNAGTEQEGEDKAFFKNGLFYSIFYSGMFYDAVDKSKDYYQGKGDDYGELIYRHFRDDLGESGLRDLICDLGISPEGRDNMLKTAKKDELDELIEAMAPYATFTEKWKELGADGKQLKDDEENPVHPMYQYADKVASLASTAKSKLEALKTGVDQYDPGDSRLDDLITAASNALQELYNFFDQDDIKGLEDVIDTKGTVDEMRKLRDPISSYRAYVKLCAGTANSGVEDALDDLKVSLNEKKSDETQSGLVTHFIDKINTYLGTNWNYTDSGHRIKNSTELRNAARGYLYGDEHRERTSGLGFMYDYGNSYISDKKEINPYYTHVDDDSYVDLDNKVYNNVFPYHENDYTKFYPFPFVFGRTVENGSERPLYVLFHYGDWLTDNLWDQSDPNSPEGVASTVLAQLQDIESGMQTIADATKNMTGNQIKSAINNFVGDENAKDGPADGTVKKCIEQIETLLSSAQTETQKANLKAVGETIESRIGTDGLLMKVRTACETHIKTNKDDTYLNEVLVQIDAWKTELEALLERIRAVTA